MKNGITHYHHGVIWEEENGVSQGYRVKDMARLMLRPTAELSIEAKTAQEMREPHMRKGG